MEEKNITLTPRIVSLLRRMRAFKAFSEADIQSIFKDAGLLRWREFDPGEVIIKQGELDSWIYCLMCGCVLVACDGVEICRYENYGDVFGEMGPATGCERCASVAALSEVSCIALDFSLIDRLHEPDRQRISRLFENVFSEIIRERLRNANLNSAKTKRELKIATSSLKAMQKRIGKLESEVEELKGKNEVLRKKAGERDPNFRFD